MFELDDERTASIPLHWVLVYGAVHGARLGDLPAEVTENFLGRLTEQSEALFKLPDVRAVFAFESVGDHFGPTVAHPHGQVIGLPFVPRRLTVENNSGSCGVCAVGEYGSLHVMRSPVANLSVAPWSRFPFEMVAAPVSHKSLLSELSEDEMRSLAQCVHTGLNLCRATYRGTMPPYLLNFMQGAKGDLGHHLRIEIVPLHKDDLTLKRPGGMELGLGVYLNPVLPEDAAVTLRAAMSVLGGK